MCIGSLDKEQRNRTCRRRQSPSFDLMMAGAIFLHIFMRLAQAQTVLVIQSSVWYVSASELARAVLNDNNPTREQKHPHHPLHRVGSTLAQCATLAAPTRKRLQIKCSRVRAATVAGAGRCCCCTHIGTVGASARAATARFPQVHLRAFDLHTRARALKCWRALCGEGRSGGRMDGRSVGWVIVQLVKRMCW